MPFLASSQAIIGLGTVYDDSFREWRIATVDDDVVGEMRTRWTFRDDWSEWDFRVGDLVATIEQKWRDDPNLWEIRCDGIVVNAKTVWPNQFNRWKLSDGNTQLNWGTRFFNERDVWTTSDRGKGAFKVSMYWEGDPREWTVTDDLPAGVSDAMRIAMIFLAVYYSTPRI